MNLLMKSIILAWLLFFSFGVQAQVGINTATPDASAQLDISSADKGLLIPRLTAAEAAAISSPATGLLIYQTDNAPGFYYYDGTAWTQLHTGILPVADGGTGSATQNFVDLTTDQSVAGNKQFNADLQVNGITIGKGAGQDDQNTAIGRDALGSGTGTRNTAVGYGAMQSYSGTSFDNNTSIGYQNLVNLTTGNANTAVGAETMISLQTGDHNTAIGQQSLISATGSQNTAVGSSAGSTVSSGSGNVIIGADANVADGTIDNAVAIGYGAVAVASNTIQLGNTNVTDVNTSGAINASSFVKTGGTSSEFLKADGSVDSNSYPTQLALDGETTRATNAEAGKQDLVQMVTDGYGITLSAANSGQIITTQWGQQPTFPDDLPDGFNCTIINYSNYPYTSNTLSTAQFFNTTTGWNGGTGTSSFGIPSGGTVKLNVITVNGIKGYFLTGDFN